MNASTTEETTYTVHDLDGDAQYTFEVKTFAAYEEVDLPAVSEAISDTVITCKSLGIL